MSKLFFTSDEHYDHANIIRYLERPFNNVEEMNEYLILQHNEVVKPDDHVYHLGDFSWGDPKRFVNRLNGRHYLILGNHDKRGRVQQAGFQWVKDVATISTDNKHVPFVFLSHYAHRIWNRRHYGVVHFFGHSHGTLRNPEEGSLDVGVDAWEYRPVSLEQALHKLFIDGMWRG